MIVVGTDTWQIGQHALLVRHVVAERDPRFGIHLRQLQFDAPPVFGLAEEIPAARLRVGHRHVAHHLDAARAAVRAHLCGELLAQRLREHRQRFGGGVHQDQRLQTIGVPQCKTHRDHAAHRVTEQVALLHVERIEISGEVVDQNVEAVRIGAAEVGRFAVAAVVRREHAVAVGEPLQLIVEVELRSGEAVQQQQRLALTLVVIRGQDVAVANEVRCQHELPVVR